MLMVSGEIVDERHCPIEMCGTDLMGKQEKEYNIISYTKYKQFCKLYQFSSRSFSFFFK